MMPYCKFNLFFFFITTEADYLFIQIFCFMRYISKYFFHFLFGLFVFFLLCFYISRNSLSVICVLSSFYFYFLNDIFERKFSLLMPLSLSKNFLLFLLFFCILFFTQLLAWFFFWKTQARIYHLLKNLNCFSLLLE